MTTVFTRVNVCLAAWEWTSKSMLHLAANLPDVPSSKITMSALVDANLELLDTIVSGPAASDSVLREEVAEAVCDILRSLLECCGITELDRVASHATPPKQVAETIIQKPVRPDAADLLVDAALMKFLCVGAKY